jgi:hypothetical protein
LDLETVTRRRRTGEYIRADRLEVVAQALVLLSVGVSVTVSVNTPAVLVDNATVPRASSAPAPTVPNTPNPVLLNTLSPLVVAVPLSESAGPTTSFRELRLAGSAAEPCSVLPRSSLKEFVPIEVRLPSLVISELAKLSTVIFTATD